ncbi:hypothetical protein Lser_V15G33540 [Lactuca serriola]
MKAHLKLRGATARVNNQQATFELKHRVVIALNKISDRDTYQIGVDELERTIKSLTPENVSPFLSCILDTDSEQKKAVRKECIRLMGTLATFHHDLIGPHIGKMVSSIVKRLKDPDAVVRDACVDTMGVLASRLTSFEGNFVVLVKPLFEAICEQNKHVQNGSALCLARVIDNAMDPPVSILQRMLIKTTKLLNNPHFMVKPAIIELNRSIIQAGGASTESSLSVAMTSIQEALKNSDWSTRKAASLALAEFASSNASYFGSFKSSSIHSLELCRFDKVKPVRDTVLQALQLWRSLKETDAFECSEARSSIKGGDYNESKVKDTRIPLSVRKNGSSSSNVGSPHNSKPNDWNIKVIVPNTHNNFLLYPKDEESEGSSVTKAFTSTQDIGYEYVPMDDKHECSSTSNIDTEKCEAKLMGVNQLLVDKEMSSEEQRYYSKIEDCKSNESNVRESVSESIHGCCMQTTKEISLFREKLQDIDNKQSNLLYLLKGFTSKTTDSLSIIQSKVSSLEHVVDQMAQNIDDHKGRNLKSTSNFLKKSSPRPSTCTPRQSLDTLTRQSPLQPPKQSDASEDSTFCRGKSGNSTNQGIDSWMDPISRNNVVKDTQKDISRLGIRSAINRKKDLDAAYVDALNSCDEVALVYLFDKTGPVLEKLSHMTVNVIVSTLATFLSEQRFMNSIIPWLHQVVELSGVHGSNHLLLTAKTRREFLYAIQEAMNMELPNTTSRRSITQLVTKMHQVWGKCS